MPLPCCSIAREESRRLKQSKGYSPTWSPLARPFSSLQRRRQVQWYRHGASEHPKQLAAQAQANSSASAHQRPGDLEITPKLAAPQKPQRLHALSAHPRPPPSPVSPAKCASPALLHCENLQVDSLCFVTITGCFCLSQELTFPLSLNPLLRPVLALASSPPPFPYSAC